MNFGSAASSTKERTVSRTIFSSSDKRASMAAKSNPANRFMSFPLEVRFPFLEKRLQPLARVVGGAQQTEQLRFHAATLFETDIQAVIDRLHGGPNRERAVAQDAQRRLACGLHQVGGRDNLAHQSDA